MDISEAIAKCNERGIVSTANYTLKNQNDWRIPIKSLRGDCEDYVNAVAWYMADESKWGMISLIFSREVVWHPVDLQNGDKHIMGRHTASGKLFDNNWRGLYTERQIRTSSSWKDIKIHDAYSSFFVFKKLFWEILKGGS